MTQSEHPANMRNLCKIQQNAACVSHAGCCTRRQCCLQQTKTRRVAAFCAYQKCSSLMMIAKNVKKCMFLKNENPPGNCHFGSFSNNVQNAATMRIFDISCFSLTFQKNAIFEQITNTPGNCHFGTPNAPSNHMQSAATLRILCQLQCNR